MSNRHFLHTGLVDTSTVLKDTGDELILLQEQLANLVKEINQFTYIITHDLQAPLRMVTGFLELLERRYADKLDAGAKQYIEYSVKGANRMKSLIFDLLEYSRLSSVKHEFDVVDMREVLEEVIGKLSVDISSSGADVIIGALPGVWADRKMMVQLLTHLLDNAIKFRSADRPVIHIDAARQNHQWQISISDNGIGIDPAFHERIFDIFKQLHPEEAGYKGTGTGLAVCKKIAELHDGRIDVFSEAGRGSMFVVSIPEKI